ncbi:MAG: hypothetical protein GF350_11555 [Chitinivibrionales bacterium]|nr:hypothetical protein [Chitinivibrionales bacterium]
MIFAPALIIKIYIINCLVRVRHVGLACPELDSGIRHPFLTEMPDSGACPGHDPGFTGMTQNIDK